MSVEQEASSPDRIPRISRPELNKLARRLLLPTPRADRHLDASRGTLTRPVRELAQSFRELTELIKGGSGAGSPADGATVGDGRRVPPPCVREGASLSQALDDDARHTVRAAKAVAKSLLSRDFTDKALMDAVGEVQPGAVAGTAGAPAPAPSEWSGRLSSAKGARFRGSPRTRADRGPCRPAP
ncbi:hypothetical protein [Streptomyces sp. NPDC002769]|uniref:hypothetical protein n=1 Tax=Streptomyces sp. NPDC002769 TaxID=3154542 RepID=UPI003321B7F8